MPQKTQLVSAAHLVLLSVGLSFICAGVYIKSFQCKDLQELKDNSAIIFIILGFILLVIGVLWTVGHRIKSVFLKSSERRLTDVHVCTVDRSNFYPPSYAESQVKDDNDEGVLSNPTDMWWPGLAPPVYSERCSEIFSEDFSLEEPPNYQQAVIQRQLDAEANYLGKTPQLNAFQQY